MKVAPIPADEPARLAALRRYRILDTAREEAFEAAASAASKICQTPIALISLVDEKRQWFKAKTGLAVCETARDISFCGHAIHGRETFVVTDATKDERFADNPLVTGEPYVRFYAGAPLVTPEGHAIGVLCVLDRVPRELRTEQREALEALARQVMAQLEMSRRVNEEAVLATERRFQRLIDAALDIIVVLGPDGRFRYLSPALEPVLGYRPEELSGRSVFECMHPEDQERERKALAFGAGGEGILRTSECRFRHKDESWRTLEVAGRMIRDEADEPIAVLNVRDITERKVFEAQLLQSQKMEAIGRLAGGVAHDFNNLLLVILGCADELESSRAGEPPSVPVEEIRKAAQRAAALTRQLLAFSRQQVLEKRPISLNTLVGDIEKMLRRLIGEDVALATVLDPQLGSVRADAGQIEQVLMNLVVNARDAMPEGGKLTIETRAVDLDDEYAAGHLSVRPGRYAMLAVSDTGSGMNAETKAQVFEPFFTTKEQGKGTGLGLATVYGIIKQSGGNVWVYSEPDHGTTFKIYLPQTAGGAVAAAGAASEAPAARGSETVLLVEDEEAVRSLARRMLESSGYTVLEASDAEDALAIAREAGTIDVLLSDVVMPEMTGSELAARVLNLRPETRVIFMSGYTDDVVVRHGVLEEGCAFLQKPFSAKALARKLREILDRPAVGVTVAA